MMSGRKEVWIYWGGPTTYAPTPWSLRIHPNRVSQDLTPKTMPQLGFEESEQIDRVSQEFANINLLCQ